MDTRINNFHSAENLNLFLKKMIKEHLDTDFEDHMVDYENHMLLLNVNELSLEEKKEYMYYLLDKEDYDDFTSCEEKINLYFSCNNRMLQDFIDEEGANAFCDYMTARGFRTRQDYINGEITWER